MIRGLGRQGDPGIKIGVARKRRRGELLLVDGHARSVYLLMTVSLGGGEGKSN